MITGEDKLLGIVNASAVTGILRAALLIFDSLSPSRISKRTERCAGFTQLWPPLHGGFANDYGYDLQVGVNVSV